jgi:Uma2 family endonuclease
MLKTQPVAVTAAEYSQMPEGPPYYQLIEGGLEMSPAPVPYHQRILINLTHMFESYLERHPIGVLYIAPFDVFLSDVNVFQPDLAFISKANASILTDKGAEGAPDLVVEILSAKTAHLDRGPKRKIYARTGVKEFWLVDPERKQVHVYHLRKDAETPAASYGEKDAFKSPLLPGLRVRCARAFARPKL